MTDKQKAEKPELMAFLIERNDLDGLRAIHYLTYDPLTEPYGFTWTIDLSKALKLADRASAEMLCVEMPDDWDVRICEHQWG